MRNKIHSLIRGGVGLALSILFINVAFADATTDARIQAYTANKLITTNIVLPTSTTATDTQEYVVFNVGTLSWQKQTKPKYDYSSLINTYAEWTTQDVTEYLESLNGKGYGNQWPFMTSDTMDDIRMYLSGIANGDITSNKISQSEALSCLQSQLDEILGIGAGSNGQNSEGLGAFPVRGLDISGKYISYMDISKCTGITKAQVAELASIDYAILSTAQYDEWKDVLSTNFSGSTIIVDGDYIDIP